MKIKKQKAQKKCVIKRKLKFENYKNCLEATQLENKINYREKNKMDIDFYIKSKSILKIQPRFKNEKRNVFTDEINKKSSNDDKRMQSIDSIETYAYGTSKDLVSDKEEVKCNNITKR